MSVCIDKPVTSMLPEREELHSSLSPSNAPTSVVLDEEDEAAGNEQSVVDEGVSVTILAAEEQKIDSSGLMDLPSVAVLQSNISEITLERDEEDGNGEVNHFTRSMFDSNLAERQSNSSEAQDVPPTWENPFILIHHNKNNHIFPLSLCHSWEVSHDFLVSRSIITCYRL